MNFEMEHRGVLRMENKAYGRSVLGAPLLYFPCQSKCKLLIVAAIHGEEAETTFLLSRSLRAFDSNFDSIAVVLCANPDGVALGTRGNASGADLNRNFPTGNWSADSVYSRSILEAPRDTMLSPGKCPGCEPETCALVALIDMLKPDTVLSVHSPIGCIDAPRRSAIVESLQAVFGLPWVPDIGYSTPGSLGTWCGERGLECVTLELPRLSPEMLFERFGMRFADFLEKFDRR